MRIYVIIKDININPVKSAICARHYSLRYAMYKYHGRDGHNYEHL